MTINTGKLFKPPQIINIFVNIAVMFMFFLSLLVEPAGGLYIHSYIVKGDLYQISELQGTGASDFLMVIIGSFFLMLAVSFVNALIILNHKVRIYLHLLCFIFSWYVFELVETAKFFDIAISTAVYGQNKVFIVWLVFYAMAFAIPLLVLMQDVRNLLTNSQIK